MEKNLRRKLLVFISSTYKDLQDERQAAVEAVLAAGHIPAGMELFTAGDKSQLETIKRWINDADAFLLILGGRYGSIEPTSKKSYVELEYLHAIERKLPHFALILNDKAIDEKVKKLGTEAIEQDNPSLHKRFKASILKKICSFVEDHKDIKIETQRSLARIYEDNPSAGWTPIKEAGDPSASAAEIAALAKENAELTKQKTKLETKLQDLTKSPEEENTNRFVKIQKALLNTPVKYKTTQTDVYTIFTSNRGPFVTGVNNAYASSSDMEFLFFTVAPHLKIHDLLEDHKSAGAKYQILRTSKLGNQFLAWHDHLHANLAVATETLTTKNKHPPSTAAPSADSTSNANTIKPTATHQEGPSSKTKASSTSSE